jgi:predicted hotdog family 3-hydroxylacyl-ACP dehydratase
MLPKSEWSQLIPHQGAMCLLDRVQSWDAERIHALSDSHTRGDNPLRSDGQLRAVHLCEYGAQAMAVHGALLAREKGAGVQPGLLVALRDVQLHVTRIDDLPNTLSVVAEKLLDSGASWQYQFRITHANALLAEGRATVMLQAGITQSNTGNGESA